MSTYTREYPLKYYNVLYTTKKETKFVRVEIQNSYEYFPLLFQANQHLIQRHAVLEPPSKSPTNNQQQPRTKTTSTIISKLFINRKYQNSQENQILKTSKVDIHPPME